MNIDRGKESYTATEVADVAARLAAHKNEEGLTWPDLAKAIGAIGESTLSAFVAGKYAGDNQMVAWRVNRWFLAEDARQAQALTKPVVPDFQATPTSRRITAQLQWAHSGEMVGIVGAPGVGKSATFRNYCAATPNAFLATMDRASRSPSPMLSALVRAAGTKSSRTQSFTRGFVAQLEDRLRDVRALLIVDEAQHLTDESLDQLRALHDSMGIGLVIAGNPRVITRFSSSDLRADFAQLVSRFSWTERYDAPADGDVNALLDAWSVSGARERELLTLVARQPGALRRMTQVLKMATLAALAADEPRALSHLKAAATQRGRFDRLDA